ncbi:MAG: sigma-54 dependent transcriptional regulator [Candidatus Omnitrophica bacterium]|nr:sigma-54 dependent transcriptional regulator [Candidatus Omnitrophota bacterium]
MKEKILLIDDEELIRITLKDILEKEGYEVLIAEDGEKGFQKFQKEKPNLVLLDIKMPGMDGISLLQKIKNISPETIVIMITAYGSIPSAVQSMKLGAFDYITKPFLPDEIIELVKRSFEFYKLKQENKFLKEKLKVRWKLEGIIGQNEKMQQIYQLIEVVAKTDATVLIQGETGTGKELIANAIHNLSQRKNNPLIKVSCAGLPETLLESELFGYEKGAFTDAFTRKIGRFELANKGTIFLDDVDDIPLPTQVKLLRVLQERKFERLGGTETIQVDVRFIAATKKDLWQLVKEGKFRDDLYYRLNVVLISIPPLRERKDDIPLLINHFLEIYCKKYNKNVSISQECISILENYDWPGNVRELENLIERAIILTNKNQLSPDDFTFIKDNIKEKVIPKEIKQILKETEKQHIIRILKQTKGKKGKAAKLLGISRKTLWQKIKEYGIE